MFLTTNYESGIVRPPEAVILSNATQIIRQRERQS